MNPARELKKIALELESDDKNAAEFVKEGWYEFKKISDLKHYRKYLDTLFGEDEAAALEKEFTFDEFEGKFGDTGKVLETLPENAQEGKVGPIPVHSQSAKGMVDRTVDGFLTPDGIAYIDADTYEKNLVA